MSILIRRIERGDEDAWARMRLSLWPEFDDQNHRSDMEDYFSNPYTKAVFVAVRPEGGLVGFLEASIRPFAEGCETPFPVGYIEGWYVDTDWRQQGLGAKMVRAAEDWARSLGCREMASDCDLTNQVSAHSHLALGYEEAARLIHFRKSLI